MLTSDVCDKINQIPGNVRGAVFQTDAKYIKSLYGQQKLDQLKDALNELGQPIAYENIQPMEWYPLCWRVLAFKVIQDLFNWRNDDFMKMGNAAPKYSFIVKLLMKFFISPKIGMANAPHYWKRHYDIGQLRMDEFNEEKQFAIIEIHDFKIDPVFCIYFSGYFKRLFSFILPKKIINIEETKCLHRGDSYHEYNVTWTSETG